jgi:S-adenosylmethionine hydrolase
VVVVDPGVGTARRPLAARVGPTFYVGPDNGALTLLLERAERENWPAEFVHLDRPGFWLPEVSHVFHGRDIFAPVAGRLASGTTLHDLGTPIQDPVRLQLPRPARTAAGFAGEVIHIDHFGSLSTNILKEHLGDMPNVIVRVREEEIHGMVRTFGDRPAGELIALYGSSGNLILSVVNGSAAQLLQAQVGEPIEVLLKNSTE